MTGRAAPEGYVTVKQLAERAELHPVSLRRMMAAGRVPRPHRFPGKAQCWSEQEVEDWMRRVDLLAEASDAMAGLIAKGKLSDELKRFCELTKGLADDDRLPPDLRCHFVDGAMTILQGNAPSPTVKPKLRQAFDVVLNALEACSGDDLATTLAFLKGVAAGRKR